jgi:capsular polysaccharide export protein
LLRGKPVSCWGHPFYAGWGLTQDSHPHPRRTRTLTLDELVAGALLRYPVYVGAGGRRCTPEASLTRLSSGVHANRSATDGGEDGFVR